MKAEYRTPSQSGPATFVWNLWVFHRPLQRTKSWLFPKIAKNTQTILNDPTNSYQ